MKTSSLCKALVKEACEDNLSFYRSMLTTQDLASVRNEEWQAIIGLARELKPHQQEILLSFARIASADALLTLCSAIDGVTPIGGRYVAFSLTDESGTEHAGSLHDSLRSLISE
jgi:hypothetical protein